MELDPVPLAWNFCPICGKKLIISDDGQEDRPHCVPCRRFYYSNPVPAACCIVTRCDEILFVQRSVEPCLGMWSLPGGFVELRETTEQAALRELEEETSLKGTGPRLIGASTQQNLYQGAVTVLGYVVEEWEGTPVAATDAMDFGFFTKDKRPELAFQAHRDLLAIFDNLDF